MLNDDEMLAGLTEADRRELLQLLELREKRRAEMPEDTRPPLEAMMIEWGGNEQLARTVAACKDPAYLAALKRHRECKDGHLTRLRRERQIPDEYQDLKTPFMPSDVELWNEARELAAADGFPEPDLWDFMGEKRTDIDSGAVQKPSQRAEVADLPERRSNPHRPSAPAPGAASREDKLADYRGSGNGCGTNLLLISTSSSSA